MPLCVHCGHLVDSLYSAYGPSNIVCTKCPICRQFADPYLEHDALLVVLDLLLVKPRVYRHMLFNTKRTTWNRSLWREYLQVLGYLIAVILVDAYLRWTSLYTHVEGAPVDEHTPLELLMLKFVPYANADLVLQAESLQDLKPIFGSYALVVLATAIEILSWHSVIAFLATLVRCCTTSQRNQSPVSHRQEATQDNDRPLTSATSPASSSRSERKDLELEQDGGAEDLFEFVLIPRALIISTLTPLLLLLLNFIWRSEGDAAWNSGSPADEGTVASMSATQCGSNILCHSVFGFAAQTDFSIDWVARTLIGGVSGGVALGVLLPHHPGATVLILCIATYIQTSIRYSLHIVPGTQA